MPITAAPVRSERRDQSRRSADRIVDERYKTFSTPQCHSCLERLADGVCCSTMKHVLFTFHSKRLKS